MATYSPSKITKDGNTYNFTDTTKIPLAGSNQISGSLIPSTDNAYDLGSATYGFANIFTQFVQGNNTQKELSLFSSNNTYDPWNHGAFISLYTNDYPGDSNRIGTFALHAMDSGNNHSILIGTPSGTLSWSGASIIPVGNNTCDLGDSTHAFNTINLGTRIKYNGTALYFTSANTDKAGMVLGYGALLPSTDAQWSLGSSSFKWDTAYFSGTVTCQTVVQTSDYRLKDEIESISDDVLDAWENLEPKQYKYKSDLETDKENAQTHYGWIAQEVESVIKGDRKSEVKSGLWLHEEWDEQEEVSHEETYTEESQTKDGTTETVIKTRKVIDQPYRAKGDSYGLRYTECLVVECAYLRKKNKQLQEQLDKVIARLDKLEGVQTK